MPKTDIDYSNTIIYKITCNDINIKEVYVGHTTNFVQRKYAHKMSSLNENLNKCKLYEVIRNNGGWNNWTMEIVNFFNCKDHYEARQKEQDYFVSLNASLNSVEPFPLKKSNNNCFYCETCNFKCYKKSNYELHLLTTKHNLTVNKINNDNITNVNKNKFCCKNCQYNTDKKYNYEKHLSTNKHIKSIINNKKVEKNSKINTISNNTCNISNICKNCNKIYKDPSGLWRHKKKCIPISYTNHELKQKDELINYLTKENQEFKGLILEVCKNLQQINAHK
jgi:hypothetical protein